MLKIKEYTNVSYEQNIGNGKCVIGLKKEKTDLKKLENFGFKYFINGCGTEGYLNGNSSEDLHIVFNEQEKKDWKAEELKIFGNYNKHINVIYDLIKADLVEKIDDK